MPAACKSLTLLHGTEVMERSLVRFLLLRHRDDEINLAILAERTELLPWLAIGHNNVKIC